MSNNFNLECGSIVDAGVRESIGHLCTRLKYTGQIRVVRTFTDGKSATQVFLAEQTGTSALQTQRLIFKVGATKTIQDECQRYLNFRPYVQATGSFVELIEPECTLKALAGVERGALAYRFAADQVAADQAVSLTALFRDALAGKVTEQTATAVLDSTLRALRSLYTNVASASGFSLCYYYLERWAPDFKIEVDRLVRRGKLLTMSRNNASKFDALVKDLPGALRAIADAEQPERELIMNNVKVTGVWGMNLGLQGGFSPRERLHVSANIASLPVRQRKQIANSEFLHVWAHTKSSRAIFHRARLREAFPNAPAEFLASPTFSLGGFTTPNPLIAPVAPLCEVQDIPISLGPAHGDLHPGNVLVAGQVPIIIDYGLAETALPIGVDVARLFGCLVREVLAEQLEFDDMVHALLVALGLPTPAKYAPVQSEICAMAGRLLGHLWRESRELVGSNDDKILPAHLYGFAWIGLKWEGSPAALRASFVLACLAAQLLQPAASTANAQRLQFPSLEPRRSGHWPQARDSLRYVLNRHAAWSDIARICTHTKERCAFLLHGSAAQNLGAFLDRIRRYFHFTPRALLPHVVCPIRVREKGVIPDSLEEWEIRLSVALNRGGMDAVSALTQAGHHQPVLLLFDEPLRDTGVGDQPMTELQEAAFLTLIGEHLSKLIQCAQPTHLVHVLVAAEHKGSREGSLVRKLRKALRRGRDAGAWIGVELPIAFPPWKDIQQDLESRLCDVLPGNDIGAIINDAKIAYERIARLPEPRFNDLVEALYGVIAPHLKD